MQFSVRPTGTRLALTDLRRWQREPPVPGAKWLSGAWQVKVCSNSQKRLQTHAKDRFSLKKSSKQVIVCIKYA